MDPVIFKIRQELKSQADPQIRKTSQRFFKENITCYGVKTAVCYGDCEEVRERGERPTKTGDLFPL